MKIFFKRVISLALVGVIALAAVMTANINVSAASAERTGTGLANFGLKAYRDGWQYNYGSYGEKNASGVRQSDCSGLIYAYLCWNGDSSNPVHDGNMPRGATQQYKACSQTGDISTLPRTHGLLLFYKNPEAGSPDNCDHVGIYVGNDMSVDNSTYGVNMRYKKASSYSKWNTWGKLAAVDYPTNGWYEFDGNPYFYENGEYVINTERTIDGTSYKFDSTGIPSPRPNGYTDGSGSGSSNDTLSISAKTTTDVNLRTGPSTSTAVVTVLSKDTSVTIINKDNADWYKVKLSNNTVGYISSQYLTESGSTPTTPPDTSVSITAVTTADVNLRESTSTSSSVITVLDEGTSVTIIEKTNASWYKVKVSNGTTGYIYSSYLEEKNSSVAPTPTPTPEVPNQNIPAVTTAYVNLRQSATTSSSVIKVVDEGTSLAIIGSPNSEWYQVKLSDGTTGYIYAQYISKSTTATPPPAPPTGGESKTGVTTAYVNLRQGATTDSSVITVVGSGSAVTITDSSNPNWYQVKLADGTVGYMYADYVTVQGTVSTTATTTAYVNMRTGAGTDNAVILVVDSGTIVTLLDTSNSGWYKVQLASGKTGYICSDYLR